MIVRRIEGAEEFQSALRVWEACFPDDRGAFCEWYFSGRTRPQYVVAAFEGEKMLGTVHMLPQRLRFFGQEKRVGFVAGVATLPQFRRRGVAAAMLNHAFELMAEEGYCATVLQPFDVGFYERFGYRTLSFRLEYRFEKGALPFCGTAVHEPQAAELMETYSAFAKHYNGMEARGEAELCRLLSEREAGARLAAVPGAYAMYYEEDGGLNVMELCGRPQAMVHLLSALNSRATVTARVPQDMRLPEAAAESVLQPFNMLRPLDEAALLSGLPCTIEQLYTGELRPNYSFESY